MQLQRICDAIDAIDAIRARVDMMQRNEFLLSVDESAKELSRLRIDLSVAAGRLAEVVDQEAIGNTTVKCATCDALVPVEATVLTPTNARICCACNDNAFRLFSLPQS